MEQKIVGCNDIEPWTVKRVCRFPVNWNWNLKKCLKNMKQIEKTSILRKNGHLLFAIEQWSRYVLIVSMIAFEMLNDWTIGSLRIVSVDWSQVSVECKNEKELWIKRPSIWKLHWKIEKFSEKSAISFKKKDRNSKRLWTENWINLCVYPLIWWCHIEIQASSMETRWFVLYWHAEKWSA